MTVPLLRTTQGRGRWDFRLWPFFRPVFRFLHRGFSRFAPRFFRAVFRFLCVLRFRVFPYFSIWFLVFGQNTSGFSDLVSNAVLGFACLVSGFWFPQPRARAKLTSFSRYPSGATNVSD